jgi:peptide/nickel transport system permease protein
VIWKHAVRNSMHVVIMMMGGILPGIISGETITAMVLNMPTTGPMYFSALINQDTYLAVTFLVFLAILLLLGNLLADILLAVVDPRIRYE